MAHRLTVALLALVGVLALGLIVLEFGLWLALVDPGEYDRGQVAIDDGTGERLGTVDVRIANTADKRTIGLGRTDRLEPTEGMLFVHDREGRHSYVMRGMNFSLDIVFVDANGTVTAIHHADPPSSLTPESLLERYTGEGKYVLEVNRGWTNETGVDVGDRVRLPDAGYAATIDSDGRERTPGTTDERTPTATRTTNEPMPTVRAVGREGTTLGSVRVQIADNRSERYTGLSETDSLGPDEGMLFVYAREGHREFVMRNMSFELDMVFVAANGTVIEIHHASLPPPGTDEDDLRRYRATAQYVLEVDRGWTNETGLDEGDTVLVPKGY
jgi:uncharacterized membrane protein (UPF0127 family)